jgi:hypothetical protein
MSPMTNTPPLSSCASLPPAGIRPVVRVSGAVWAEYWLELDRLPTSGRPSLIRREIRCLGGAAVACQVLSQWLREIDALRSPQSEPTQVEAVLEVGEDPNARFVRRGLESAAARAGNLALELLPTPAQLPYLVFQAAPVSRTPSSEPESRPGADWETQLLQCGELGDAIRASWELSSPGTFGQTPQVLEVPTRAVLSEACRERAAPSAPAALAPDMLGASGAILLRETARWLASQPFVCDLYGASVDAARVGQAAEILARAAPGAVASWEQIIKASSR